MVKPLNPPFLKIRASAHATAWWLMDSLASIPVAAGIALAIGTRLAPGRSVLWPALLLAAGGGMRAFAVRQAQMSGQAAANATAARLRARLHPALLPSRLIRGNLIGEDLHLAVTSITATEGQVARFLPLRSASGLSPLVIAMAVAPASWVSSLILLATLVPFILAMALAGGAAAKRAEAQHVALSRLTGLFVDRLRALPAILSFGTEPRIARHLGVAATDVARRTMAVLAIAFASSAILEFFAALSVALVAVYCGFTLLGLLPFAPPEHLTGVGAFYTLALAPEFYLMMRRLAAAYHDKQQGEAAMAAMSAALAKVPTPPLPKPAPTLWSGQAVLLTHPEGASIGPLDWWWSGLGLHVVTGPTGSGKTSLLLALIGQVPIGGGDIIADGLLFAPGAFNDAIGWAGQQVAFLPGSLHDNLAMGDARPPDMLACLGRLGLGTMLARRGGLEMVIDHRGSGLSGGERRRIGLARAILSGRPLLLLDEPTADLDAPTAAAISTVLIDLARTHMVVAATHDADLIAMAHTLLEIAP